VLDDDHRRERRLIGPLGRIDGLPVVVEVKGDRPPQIRRAPLGEDDGRSRGRDALGQKAAVLEHPRQGLRVALDVALVRRHVRNRQEVEQLEQDLFLVIEPPRANARRGVVGGCERRNAE
jgi:hypothetical protein